jgi:hypothetical protein
MKLSKPSLLFESKHLDHAGGGTHSRQIIYLLSEFFTVYCEKDVVALIQLFLRMRGDALVDESSIVYSHA